MGKLPVGRPPKVGKVNRLNAYLLMNEEHYRPVKDKKVIDLDVVSALAAIGATKEELSTALGCSHEYVNQQLNDNPAFKLAFEQGYVTMKHSLRRAQIAMALNGSAALLIWLGKQHLNQSDKQELNNHTEVNITVTRAMDELRNIPKDQLLSSLRLLQPGGAMPQVIENSNESQEG